MRDWAIEEFRALPLEEIDVRYGRYRLAVLEAEEAMARSLRRYGQMSLVVVCLREETPVLIDGFKRLTAARGLKGFGRLSARRIEVDERGAKAAMMEKLCAAAQEDLRLGLLSPTMARQLTRLPAGNQQEALQTGRRDSLTAAELRGMVDLLLASGTREKAAFVLERPREALREAQAGEVRGWWLAEVADVRVHRQTQRRPIDLHAEELPHLIPLPERPYAVAEVVYRTVDAEGMVAYGQNRYSAPWQFIGQVLPLRITDDEVLIYDPRLEPLARHPRFPTTAKHQQRRLPQHLPPRDLTQRREALRERFSRLGPLAVRFLEGLLAAHRYGWDQAQKVLALLGIYRRDDLLAALDRAVRYGAFSAKSIERILAVQARPKTTLEHLAEDQPPHLAELLGDDPTPPRPAAEYQHLLRDESDYHDETKADDPDEDDDGQPCGQPA